MITVSVSTNDCLTKFTDLIPEPVVVIYDQEKIVDVNHSVWKLSGYIKEQLVGKKIFDLNFIDDENNRSLAGNVIPDEILPKLFSPLLTIKAQGMEFGLAICKHIVEAHGESIAVKTAKGKETTFTVSLPIEPKVKMGGE